MSAAVREAERLRWCRAIFERGVADNVGMAEAKRRLRADRWIEAELRLAAKRAATAPDTIEPEDDRPQRWWLW